MDEKTILRTELKVRRAVAFLQHTDAAAELLSQFMNIKLPSAPVVAGYAAFGTEISPDHILQFLQNENIQTCLPSMPGEQQTLGFREYQFGDDLFTPAKQNMCEPAADRTVVVPNVLLVPLLGFDRTGNRIGYGKGYYDRTLAALRAKNKNTLAIGLAFAAQEEPEIPAEPHDQSLNYIVTPSETIYCPAL